MQTNENVLKEHCIEDMEDLTYTSTSHQVKNGGLFISSFSNCNSDINDYYDQDKSSIATNLTTSLPISSTQNLNVNVENFEENFNNVFQSAHEPDEYSDLLVRILYYKYLSNQQSQQQSQQSSSSLSSISKIIGKDSYDSSQTKESSSSSITHSVKKQKLYRNCYNRLRRIKKIPIDCRGVFTAHLMEDGTIGLGSWSNSLFFLNPISEKTIEVPGHQRWVKYIIPLDNNRIASCSEDSSLRIWDSRTYECLAVLEADFATEGLMSLLQLSTDKIVCGSSDGLLIIWDITNHLVLDSIHGSDSGIFVIKRVNNDSQLIIGSFDNTMYIYAIEPFLHQVGKLEGHSGWVKPLLTFKEYDLVTTGEDGVIKLWNTQNYHNYQTLIGHTGGIWCGIIKNDTILYTGAADCTIRIWDLTTYQCLTVIIESSTVTALIELGDGRLISGTFNNELSIYSID